MQAATVKVIKWELLRVVEINNFVNVIDEQAVVVVSAIGDLMTEIKSLLYFTSRHLSKFFML